MKSTERGHLRTASTQRQVKWRRQQVQASKYYRNRVGAKWMQLYEPDFQSYLFFGAWLARTFAPSYRIVLLPHNAALCFLPGGGGVILSYSEYCIVRLDRSRFKWILSFDPVPSFNTLRWTRFQFPRPLSMLSIDRVACVDPLVLVNGLVNVACSVGRSLVVGRSCIVESLNFQSRSLFQIRVLFLLSFNSSCLLSTTLGL